MTGIYCCRNAGPLWPLTFATLAILNMAKLAQVHASGLQTARTIITEMEWCLEDHLRLTS